VPYDLLPELQCDILTLFINILSTSLYNLDILVKDISHGLNILNRFHVIILPSSRVILCIRFVISSYFKPRKCGKLIPYCEKRNQII
jgi:hypothetical protein